MTVAAEDEVRGGAVLGCESASFESAIGKLGWVSGQTGLLRQRLVREDRILP